MKTSSALDWLLEQKDPPIRYRALVDILHRPLSSPEVIATKKRLVSYGPVMKIMAAQTSDGYWPPDDTCYRPKFTSAVWDLMLLGEMAVPAEPWIKMECERFLSLHQMDNGAFSSSSRAGGRRMDEEPCLTGNMIRILVVLGYGDDQRVRKAIDWMPEEQLEDGGWNCDYPHGWKGRKVRHSSFMSTIEPLWAYSEVPRQKWTRRMKRSIERGAEFLLMHRLYKADHQDWKPIHRIFTVLHFPVYYFYDVLHGLRVLTKLGYGDDERMKDAAHLVLSKRRPDGKWLLESDWFREQEAYSRELKEKARGSAAILTEPWGNPMRAKTIVDLEQVGKPSKWVTLNCYTALSSLRLLE